MDSQLLKLRSDNYAAASTFHRVVSEYFTALRGPRPDDESGPVTVAFEEAAALYAHALEDLFAHLKTLEQTPAVQEELRRVERIRELLWHESQLMGQLGPG